MPVSRISKEAIKKMMRGRVNVERDTLCVIKFYSNGCHLCHALSSYYVDICEQYEDVLFYAFNVDDDNEIPTKLNLNGVPSISLVKIKKGQKAEILNMPDPDRPNNETWFTTRQIKNFIEKELK